VPELAGLDGGDLLLPNDEDLTYAKVRLDPVSRANLPSVLGRLDDPLARALVWSSSADAVRDADMAVEEFLALCDAALPVETEVSVLKDVTRFATSRAADALATYAGVLGRFVAPERVAAVESRVASACRGAMTAAAAGSGVQLVAARGYIAATDRAGELQEWLEGGAPPGLVMDAELRWTVLARLVLLGAAGPASIDAEAERDPSAQGAVHAAVCHASLPDETAKARAWQTIMHDATLSNRLVVGAAEGFWHPGQASLTESYVERYFAEVPGLAARRSPWMTIQAGSAAFPRYAADPRTIARAEELAGRSGLDPTLRRVVLDATDELRRALAGRRLDQSDVFRPHLHSPDRRSSDAG
jgi:aminopeptidase N